MIGVSKIACTIYLFSIMWYIYLAIMSYVDYVEHFTKRFDDCAYKKCKAIVESVPEDAFAKVTAAAMVLVAFGVLLENICQ